LALRCSIRYLIMVHYQPLVSGLTTPGGRFRSAMRWLSLSGFTCPACAGPVSPWQGSVCACTHYLVFKEPTSQSALGALPHTRVRLRRSFRRRRRFDRPRSGELIEITIAASPCQPLSSGFVDFLEAVRNPVEAEQLSFVRQEMPSKRTWQYFRGQKSSPLGFQQTLRCPAAGCLTPNV